MAQATKQTTKPAGISDAAVERATGRPWQTWFRLLDRAGAKNLSHKEIVARLAPYGLSGWWQQMVAVTYEQARGLRDVHQTSKGYQVGASKTVAAPLSTLYAAWSDTCRRKRWLPERGLAVRKATSEKSMRIAWRDGTSVDVNFYDKRPSKSQVSVNHTKLADARAAERMKAYWKDALARLEQSI